MNKDSQKVALARILGVALKDIERLKDHPVARVTISAPGGFHVQTTVAEVMEKFGGEIDSLVRSLRPAKAKAASSVEPSPAPVGPAPAPAEDVPSETK